jgi:hypothetical protein
MLFLISAALLSQAHIAAIGFPETSNRRFRDAALAALRLTAAHFQNRFLLGRPGDAALDEAANASVLHGDVARRSDEIALLDRGPYRMRRKN